MSSMATLFQSQRLVYRAVEDNDADLQLLLDIASDSEAYSKSTVALLVPVSRADAADYHKHLMKGTLISTIICIPAQDELSTQNPAEDHPGQSTAKKPEPTPIGVISLNPPSQSQAHHRRASISVDIKAGYRGKGYGSEAIKWVLDWGFRIAGLHRISIEAAEWNTGASKLYEKLGFTFELKKREIFWYDGGWKGLLVYSMLEDEWREMKEKESVSTSLVSRS